VATTAASKQPQAPKGSVGSAAATPPAAKAVATPGKVGAPAPSKLAEEEMVTVYRGVTEGHPGIGDASVGTAYPRGGHSDPEMHTLGNTESVFTSWTTDPGTAKWFATRWGDGGFMLELRIPKSRLITSPAAWMMGEFEVLIEGPVLNAEPTWIRPPSRNDGF
jgi:hypothetical protein